MIPKILHRIWVGGPMPERYVHFGERFKELHPGWEIRTWGNGDFGWLKNQDLFDKADKIAPADGVGQYRSDLARYEILEKHGGVYVDCDVEPLRPFDGLLGVDAFAGWEEQGQVVGNTVLGSVPGHPIWAEMQSASRDNSKANAGRSVTWLSGPRIFTRVVTDKGGVTLYPQGYFFPYSYKDLKSHPELKHYPDAYSVHHWGHQRELRGRPLVEGGDGRLSVAIMAHEKRRKWVDEYLVPALPEATVVWDRKNDRWDTGSRALAAHSDSEWHMVVQDDSLLPQDFVPGVQNMLRHVPPGVPVGLYYGRVRPRMIETRNQIAEADRMKASFIVHNGPWWGVGIVLPTAQIAEVLEWGKNREDIPNYDRRIARYYAEQGVDCWYPQPSLIDHRQGGENPSLVAGRTATNRRAYRYVGPQSALEVGWSGPVVRSRL